MITNEMGTKLKALLDTGEIYVSISPKTCESRDFYIESQFNYQRLSYVSIWFIVVGNLCLLVLLGGSCTIFYIVQKTRLIEERERMDVGLILQAFPVSNIYLFLLDLECL